MILRLHHHRDIWQRWKLKAPGPGILLGAWSERCQLWGRGGGGGGGGTLDWFLHSCELQHWISQPTTETTIASVSQLVKT